MEKQADDTERLASGMHYALFGIPEDRTNNGLVGAMAEMQRTLRGILFTVIGGVGMDVLLRLLNVHS